jgi:hypothetical protein
MALLQLKDLTQAIEIVRRSRRELAEGPVRDQMDEQLLTLARHITAIVGEDERIARRRQAELQAKTTAPSPHAWANIVNTPKLDHLVHLILNGAKAAEAWKQVLT